MRRETIKKKLGFSIAFLACFLAFCQVAFALPSGIADTGVAINSLQLDQNWTGTVQSNLGNWYTGYGFTMTAGTYTADETWSFCVSETPGPSGSANNTYYVNSFNNSLVTNSTLFTQYEEAAYLLNEARLGLVNPVTAQAATWAIMFPEFSFTSDSNGDTWLNNIQPLVQQAENNVTTFVNSGGLNNYYLAMSSGYQDFVFYDNDPVPEPSTLLLLGFGLVGLVGSRWRRK